MSLERLSTKCVRLCNEISLIAMLEVAKRNLTTATKIVLQHGATLVLGGIEASGSKPLVLAAQSEFGLWMLIGAAELGSSNKKWM